MKQNKTRKCEPLHFRRFANKSYSAFTSIGKEVNISVLLVGMLTFATPVEVIAQERDNAREKEYEMDEVEVTASRAPLTISQSARIVTVLDRKTITEAPVQSVNDLLKYAVGVDVRQRGVQGMQTDISLRGSTYDQITILLNGVNICDPQTGHNVDFPVDLNDIERIEILEGPAARIYGTSSLLGAINIVTKTESKNFFDINASTGSYGNIKGGGRVNIASGKIINNISANYNRSDGYLRNSEGRLNTDFNGAKLLYQGQFSNKNADVSWMAGYSNKNYGSNTFYSAKFDNQFEHARKYYASAQATTKGKIQFKPAVYWTRGEDRFELIRGNEDVVPFNYHSTDIFGMNTNAYFNSILGKTALGAEIRNEDIKSTVLGEPLEEPLDIPGTDRQYNKGIDRTNISFFLEHNILLDNFTLSAGVMATKNSMYKGNFKFYPGIDASYRIGNSVKLYGSWNRSLRLPTFTELYYATNETHQGNKHLKPEEMTAYEIGIKYNTSAVKASASLFHHIGTNLIDWVKKNNEEIWHSINHTKINSTGLELSSTFNFTDIIGANSFLRSVYLGYTYINQDKKENEGEISQYSLEYLKHKFVARIEHNIFGSLKANWSFRWQDREGSYVKYEGKNAVGTVNYKPYSLLDAKIIWDKPSYNVYIEANNIFNHTYYDYGNVPQPGFWFMTGFNYRFNL